jgi:hypothetical protein
MTALQKKTAHFDDTDKYDDYHKQPREARISFKECLQKETSRADLLSSVSK